MASELTSLADRSAEQAALFELGLSPHSLIVSWADDLIVAMPAPPIELIDLSLSSSKHDGETLELLWRLAEGAHPESLRPALIECSRRIADRTLGLRTGLSRLLDFARRHVNEVGKETEHFLVWADDEYDLIDLGIANNTFEQLEADLEKTLRGHCGREESVL